MVKDVPLMAYVVDHHSLELKKKIEIVTLLLSKGAKPQDYSKKEGYKYESHSIIGDAVDRAARDKDQNERVCPINCVNSFLST